MRTASRPWVLCSAMALACGARSSASLDSIDPLAQGLTGGHSCTVDIAGSGSSTPPALGPSTALVTMVEYGDFECPYCAEEEPVVSALRTAYGANLRFEWRNFPLTSIHPNAEGAAVAARCAGVQGKFWPMHDSLFAHQKALDAASLATYAEALGLDMTAFSECISCPQSAQAVAADVALGQSLGVQATPTFFINGEEMVGAYPQSDIASVIDAKLAEAGASGVTNGDQ